MYSLQFRTLPDKHEATENDMVRNSNREKLRYPRTLSGNYKFQLVPFGYAFQHLQRCSRHSAVDGCCRKQTTHQAEVPYIVAPLATPSNKSHLSIRTC